MTKQIIVASHKGGVDKTTITTNLAIGIITANEKAKVLLVDCDPQANLSKKFLDNHRNQIGLIEALQGEKLNKCIHGTEYANLDILPSKQRLSVVKKEITLSMHGVQQETLLRTLKPVMNKYDFILFDTAPGLDIMTFNVLQFLNGDGLLIIPVIPDADTIEDSDSIEGMNLLLDEIKESIEAGENINPKFKVLITEDENDEDCACFKNKVMQHFGNYAFKTTIPFNRKHNRKKANFVIEKSRTKIARHYKNLTSEIMEAFYE